MRPTPERTPAPGHVTVRPEPQHVAAPQHPETPKPPSAVSMVMFSPGCPDAPDGAGAARSAGVFRQFDLQVTWSAEDVDGAREALLTRQGLAAGSLWVEPARHGLVGRLWRGVVRATSGVIPGRAPGPDRTPRRALLSLDAVPAPRSADRPPPVGEWNLLLMPVWRTAAGTTLAVAQLPVPCQECDQPHGGGICVLLPLSGSQEQ
ncbi:hypothetical protein [Streptomyces sp. NPDC059010]|uniref:hypothetical protein n=1 Tax=Streptomyces sp. NPDC059010 TaxID=3346695 RepID=UPI0036A9C523